MRPIMYSRHAPVLVLTLSLAFVACRRPPAAPEPGASPRKPGASAKSKAGAGSRHPKEDAAADRKVFTAPAVASTTCTDEQTCRVACDEHAGRACTRLGEITELRTPSAAAPLYERACRAGDVDGCERLQSLHTRGFALSADAAEITRLYRRLAAALDNVCAAGGAAACDFLARLYGERGRLSHDADKVLTYVIRACRAEPQGCSLRVSEHGIEETAPEQAAALYDEGCAAGDGLACSSLAALHEAGRGVAADPQRARATRRRARELHEQGCEAGDPLACRFAAQDSLSDPELATDAAHLADLRARAVELSRSRCSPHDTRACGALADAYAEQGGPSCRLLELETHRQACAWGDPQACWSALRTLEYHHADIPQRFGRGAAATIEETACRSSGARRDLPTQGGPALEVTCAGLAELYAAGTALPLDSARALRLYALALPRLAESCETRHDGRTCCVLADSYRHGRGAPVDARRADELSSRALGWGYRCE